MIGDKKIRNLKKPQPKSFYSLIVIEEMSCYGNSCNTGSCYNPSGSSCYPNTAYLCAPPQPCRQTVFRSGNGGTPNVLLAGTVLGSNSEGSCTDWTNFQIEGSGLSIVGICVGTNTDTGAGTFKVCTAGTICSCPNNFTSTFYLNKFIGAGDLSTGTTTVQAVGCINWCVCGCNVCGTGSFTGIAGGNEGTDPNTFSGTVQVQGSSCSNCGTRNICINNITISG